MTYRGGGGGGEGRRRRAEGNADEDLEDEEEEGCEDKKGHGQKYNSVSLWISFPIGDVLDLAPLQQCLPSG